MTYANHHSNHNNNDTSKIGGIPNVQFLTNSF